MQTKNDKRIGKSMAHWSKASMPDTSRIQSGGREGPGSESLSENGDGGQREWDRKRERNQKENDP